MVTKIIHKFLIFVLSALFCISAFAKDFNFTVFLNDKEIGDHRFQFSDSTVSTQANFDVKLWFIPAYKYRHTSNETYTDGCLTKINSDTQDGADTFKITTDENEPPLSISVNQESKKYDSCLQTFRYWDIDFLNQKKALNPQDGDLYELNFTEDGADKIFINGNEVETHKYTLKAYNLNEEKFHIELWYSASDNQWLKLKSFIKDDVIAYAIDG